MNVYLPSNSTLHIVDSNTNIKQDLSNLQIPTLTEQDLQKYRIPYDVNKGRQRYESCITFGPKSSISIGINPEFSISLHPERIGKNVQSLVELLKKVKIVDVIKSIELVYPDNKTNRPIQGLDISISQFNNHSNTLPSIDSSQFNDFINNSLNKGIDEKTSKINVNGSSVTKPSYSRRSNFIWKFLTRRQLKKEKIYLIVKPKLLNFNGSSQKSKEANEPAEIGYSVLPISNIERISDHGSSNMFLDREILFEHTSEKVGIYAPDSETRPQDRGKRPYSIDHSLSTYLPYEHDLPYQSIGIKPDDLGIYDRQLLVDELSSKVKNYSYKNFLKRTKSSLADFWILPDEEDEDFDETIYWVLFLNQDSPYSKDFEYNYADLDGTAMFSTQNNYKNSGKDIIPIFANFEEAEKFLLTTLEDLLEPYKKQQIYTTADSLGNISTNTRFNNILDDRKVYNPKNVDYLDESTSFTHNNYESNLPNTKKERKLNKLAEQRKIKTISNYQDHYNNYDSIGDLFGVKKKSPWYSTVKPTWMPKAQKAILETIEKTEIIEMDLEDFLEFWVKDGAKKGEILYIPTSTNSKSFRSKSSKKGPMKKIHRYQRDYYNKSKRKNTKYSYTMKKK